jgi:hypothetical protein
VLPAQEARRRLAGRHLHALGDSTLEDVVANVLSLLGHTPTYRCHAGDEACPTCFDRSPKRFPLPSYEHPDDSERVSAGDAWPRVLPMAAELTGSCFVQPLSLCFA